MNNSTPVWTPSTDDLENSRMSALMREIGVTDYNELWEWSVADVGRFWRHLWEMFDIPADGDPARALANADMPGARWFPEVALSFPEFAFRNRPADAVAIRFVSEDGTNETWTWARLTEETTRIRAGLRAMGVVRGDRVAAYLPNVPETIAAFFAVSSLGAIWACCSPDFGSRTVIDRLEQIEPKVLLAVDGYRFNGRYFDRSSTVRELATHLDSLERTVRLDRAGRDDWNTAFPSTDDPLEFERVPFDHPLWIVFSSGTTGLPKAIVHGHGGVLLEQLKSWLLHHDTTDRDVVFWYTTTGWVMWNLVVGALATSGSVVVYDGSPTYPDKAALWDVVEKAGVTLFGAGAAYLHGCMKQGLAPAEGRDLRQLRAISSSGSPLAPEAYHWVADQLGSHIWLSSSSGGTDIAGAFVGGSPVVPVHAGELSSRLLGVHVEAWDDAGNTLHDQMGELVVTKPMPSMPVKLWNDPDGSRYRESYFSTYPGVWRHGDWIRITSRGSAVIYGRSDSTINRGGVRMGTAEIYAALMTLEAIVDAVVVDIPHPNAISASTMQLFVVLDGGHDLTEELTAEIRDRIRQDCSPRHIPDNVTAAPAVPRTLSGKVLEVPVKKVLMGWDPAQAANRDALANPDAFDWFVDYAQRSRTTRDSCHSHP
ncbi:acetoacetate--CoA ligase [Rhodococcus ruber]|uniref:acetoacetate--CoA ligase n=1 Tax=Rhodococcus ruber TaxID=1830 RepID=UPI00265F0CDA|nr:acetoacetate--CoA ligase [Rhodococcus ruber]MDO1481604.1 acetoacetate--CoA ligase [Rhodococcus ruber]